MWLEFPLKSSSSKHCSAMEHVSRVISSNMTQLHLCSGGDKSWKVGNDGKWRRGVWSGLPTRSVVLEPDSSALCTSSSGAYPSGWGVVLPAWAPVLSAQGWPRLPPPAGRTLTPTAGRRSCCARSLSKQREIASYSRGWMLHSVRRLLVLVVWSDQFKSIFDETGKKKY